MICLRFYLTSLHRNFLKKTDTGTTSRIIEAIEKLADDPIQLKFIYKFYKVQLKTNGFKTELLEGLFYIIS